MARAHVDRSWVVEVHVVERESEPARRVVAFEDDLTAADDAHVLQTNVAIPWDERAGGFGRRGVVRVHLDRIFRVANADVAVLDVVHEPAAARVRLDTEAVVGAVDGEIEHADRARTAVSLTPDRHAVTAIEMI